MGIVARLDDWGRPAWILVMIAGFVLFWPVGLAILAFMIWSRRMGCMHHNWSHEMGDEMRGQGETMRNEWRARREEWRAAKRQWRTEMRDRWHGRSGPATSSGNEAFDDYKAETLKRLEEEQAEFHGFLDNLRRSKDKAEFDDFMEARRSAKPAANGNKDDTKDDDGPNIDT